MEDSLPDFSNKVVYVFFDSGGDSRTAVENPRFELQGGVLFLVGRGLMSKGWGCDLPVGIAWSKVQWYSVFDSIDAFDKAGAYYWNKKSRFWNWKRRC